MAPAPHISPTGDSTESLPQHDWATIAEGVRLIALRQLGDADAAEDVAQETVFRTIRALQAGHVKDLTRLGAFARGVAYHVIADHRRAAAKLESLSDDFTLSAQPDGLDALVSNEETACMQRALFELSAVDRHILRLMFVEGLSAPEVAERLGTPPARVRKRKSRALERLRELLCGRQPVTNAPLRRL